ncbi:MAG: branched-chain amino acid ABC transporter permease [Dehalococcoidia bacterium]
MDPAQIAQEIINALSLGALFALLTLGLALTFGVMRLVNFAYGELLMVGGYTLFVMRGHSFALSVIVMMIVVIIVAIVMERVAFRPVRSADPSTLLVTSLAVSIFLQNFVIFVFGSQAKSVAVPSVFLESVSIRGVIVTKLAIITIVLAALLVGGLTLFLKRTTLGIQMRAAAEDFEMARLLGTRADRVVVTAFIISGILAGCAAFVVTAQTGALSPTMGLSLVIVAFVATVVGGMGSIVGAAVGAFALASASVLMQSRLPQDLLVYRDAFVYLAVICVLLIRPQGLFAGRAGHARP